MQDINHNPLRVGDHIRVHTYGEVEILSQVSTDIVKVKVPNGSKCDIHLQLSRAEFVAPQSYNGAKRRR